MKTINLSKGKFAIVDDEDFEHLNFYGWHLSSKPEKPYACRTENISKKRGIKKKTTIYMHKIIMPSVLEVDHVNGNSLDNRKSNLRICTHYQNSLNLKKYKNNKTGFRGVYFYKPTKKFGATIRVGTKLKFLGYFKNLYEAAGAYAAAANIYFGDYYNEIKLP